MEGCAVTIGIAILGYLTTKLLGLEGPASSFAVSSGLLMPLVYFFMVFVIGLVEVVIIAAIWAVLKKL